MRDLDLACVIPGCVCKALAVNGSVAPQLKIWSHAGEGFVHQFTICFDMGISKVVVVMTEYAFDFRGKSGDDLFDEAKLVCL